MTIVHRGYGGLPARAITILVLLLALVGCKNRDEPRRIGPHHSLEPHTADALPPSTSRREVPLVVDDPERVTASVVLEQATKLAVEMDEHAALSSLRISSVDSNGVLDFQHDYPMDLTFLYHYSDRSKPPGADVLEGNIGFHLHVSRCPTAVPCFTIDRADGRLFHGEVPQAAPKCSFEDARRAAVADGVPANAIFAASYGWSNPNLWELEVKGHDELRRYVDAQTCRMSGSRAISPDEVETPLGACCATAPPLKRAMCFTIAQLVQQKKTSLASALHALQAQGVDCPSRSASTPWPTSPPDRPAATSGPRPQAPVPSSGKHNGSGVVDIW